MLRSGLRLGLFTYQKLSGLSNDSDWQRAIANLNNEARKYYQSGLDTIGTPKS